METQRTYLVTGADSGIGAEVAAVLRQSGAEVITAGVGSTCDIKSDLATNDGRSSLVDELAALAPQGIDGVAMVAGVGAAKPETVRLNYFGTTTLAELLLPSLAGRDNPRMVVVSSASTLSPGDPGLIQACLSGDEETAAKVAEKMVARRRGPKIYRSTKIALNIWLRRTAASRPWTNSGVLLNAVAPGIVDTEGVRADILSSPARRKLMAEALPQPLGMPGPVRPVAEAIAWLLSDKSGFITGQVIFVDEGADATLRGEHPYLDGFRYGPVRMLRMIYWALVAVLQDKREANRRSASV